MTRWLPDKFILALLGTVALATLIPATGRAVPAVDWASNLAIGLLFFLHGARLSRKAILDGLRQPGLHAAVFASTFILFPLLGLGLEMLFPHLVAPELWTGVLFVCTLSSTVQSSIAFTSIARGNVSAAVCAARRFSSAASQASTSSGEPTRFTRVACLIASGFSRTSFGSSMGRPL